VSIGIGEMLPFAMTCRVDYLFRIPGAEKLLSFLKHIFELLERDISRQVCLTGFKDLAYLIE
jgi:hypothetical protein